MIDTKQVIVMRKDLNMRKGKMIAQGAHASMAFLTRRLERSDKEYRIGEDSDVVFTHVELSPAENWWRVDSFKKICVYVESDAELQDIQLAAYDAGLECHVITDNGDTEFGGVPTVTCLAIGPDYSDKIDPITGHLPLL